jgi:hypothetical protein
MRSFLGEDFFSKSFPYRNRKFVKSRNSRHKGDPGRTSDSEIELSSHPLIGNITYSLRKTGWAFDTWFCFCRARTEKSFGQWLRDECARSNSRPEISFRMKPRESDVYSEARYAQLRGQVTRGGESRRVVVEACRSQFIANLPVKLLMQWFGRCAIQPNHFKGQDRMAAAFPMKIWRWTACSRKLSALGTCSRLIGVRRCAFSSDHEQEHEHEHG